MNLTSYSSDLVNPVHIEKMLLARKVGRFLDGKDSDGDRAVIENIARMLARDVCAEVREVLSFELRTCSNLPGDLVQRIVRDTDDVAEPFLETSTILPDDAMADLVPALSEYLKTVVARRSDIGDMTICKLADTGGQDCVGYLIRNDAIKLPENASRQIVSRFHGNEQLMDQLSIRKELPADIMERLVDLVSYGCRSLLERKYKVSQRESTRLAETSRTAVLWNHISTMSPDQIRAFVIDQRDQNRLTHDMILTIGRRGGRIFMESALAVLSGRNIKEVRRLFSLQDPQAFAFMIKRTGAKKSELEAYLQLASRNNSGFDRSAGKRSYH